MDSARVESDAFQNFKHVRDLRAAQVGIVSARACMEPTSSVQPRTANSVTGCISSSVRPATFSASSGAARWAGVTFDSATGALDGWPPPPPALDELAPPLRAFGVGDGLGDDAAVEVGGGAP